MRELPLGLEHRLRYVVPVTKTVPHLYPESPRFRSMPEVFATGFMVGLVEWACIEAIAPHLDAERELSVGVGVNLTHLAATPPGMAVEAHVRLQAVDGRRLTFSAVAEDERERICDGSHERFVIDRARFLAGVERKRAPVAGTTADLGGPPA